MFEFSPRISFGPASPWKSTNYDTGLVLATESAGVWHWHLPLQPYGQISEGVRTSGGHRNFERGSRRQCIRPSYFMHIMNCMRFIREKTTYWNKKKFWGQWGAAAPLLPSLNHHRSSPYRYPYDRKTEREQKRERIYMFQVVKAYSDNKFNLITLRSPWTEV